MGDLENFSCDVHQPANHWWDPPKVQNPNTESWKTLIEISCARKSSHSSCLHKCNETLWRWRYICLLTSFHRSLQFILTDSYQWMYPIDSLCQLSNLAGCVRLHYQELKPPWGPYFSHVSQTVIKQQSVCVWSWIAVSQIAGIPQLLIASDNYKGFWQPPQTQQGKTTQRYRLKTHHP